MMENNSTPVSLTQIAGIYMNVIRAWKNRTDVLSGKDIGYHDNQDRNDILRLENKPFGIGDGLTTTGFCVSVSQSFLEDNAFKILLSSRGAQAKLISIDIKQQFFGTTYSGHTNTWHTAILVSDSGVNFVIDLTCAQFGNPYVEKFIWDFETWQHTFRSKNCTHQITDFNGAMLGYYNNQPPLDTMSNFEILSKIEGYTQSDINFMSEVLSNGFCDINTALMRGNVNKPIYNKINRLNKLLRRAFTPVKTEEPRFGLIPFNSRKELAGFVSDLMKNGFVLPQYVLLFNSMDQMKNEFNQFYGYFQNHSLDNFNIVIDRGKDGPHYLCLNVGINNTVLNGGDIMGYDILPYGYVMEVNYPEEDIYNGSKLNHSSQMIPEKTNTIFISF